MVRRRLVGAVVELDGLGLLDGGVNAFLIVQGDGRFGFAEDAGKATPDPCRARSQSRRRPRRR